MGLAFILGPMLMLVPMLLVKSATQRPFEKYNYEEIIRSGTPATAHITDIYLVTNVNVNGQSPRLITYQYTDGGQPRTDQFETFDTERASTLHPNDELSIKVLDGKSIIPALKPFSFPFTTLLLAIPGLFTLVGLPFLLIGLLPTLKKYRLYRYGLVRAGTVQGITAQSRIASLASAVPGYIVSYQYAGLAQLQVFGESLTNDMLLVNSKKLNDTVQILVSPTDEKTSCLLPRLVALKNNWQI